MYTVEPLYCGHPWDMKSVLNREVSSFQESNVCNPNVTYSATSLLWTPLGQESVSLIERCPHFRVRMYTIPNIWDIVSCPG